MEQNASRSKSNLAFLVGIILGLLLIVCAGSWLVSFFLRSDYRNDAVIQVERFAEQISPILGDQEALAMVVPVIENQLGGHWFIQDSQGTFLFNTPDEATERLFPQITAEGSYFAFIENDGSQRNSATGIVLTREGEFVGKMLWIRSTGAFDAQLNNLRLTVVILLILAGIFSWGMYLRVSEGFYQALKRITGGVYALTEELEPEWPAVDNKEEWGQLVGSIRFFDAYHKGKAEKTNIDFQRLSRVIDHLREGILLVSEMRRIIYTNQAAGELLGYEPAGLAGEPVQEVIRDLALTEILEDAAQGVKHGEYRLRTLLPSQRLLKTEIFPLPHQDQDDPAVLIILQDESEIEKLSQMRSEFVANVSHELRTPLTSIKGFAETVLDSGPEDISRIQRFVGIIESEADRLTRLIDDLLDLARIESGKIRLEFKRTNIRRVIQETVEKLMPQLEKAQIEIEMDTQEAVTPILADPDRLAQVLMNYVDNSMKYTHQGGQIHIRATETDKEIVVEVTDNGVGIPPQDLERVFERFYRVDKARTRASGGTGLGLAIVKHIIEAHGGKVFVRSTPGSGSTFGFSLPKGDV